MSDTKRWRFRLVWRMRGVVPLWDCEGTVKVPGDWIGTEIWPALFKRLGVEPHQVVEAHLNAVKPRRWWQFWRRA